MKKFSKMVIVSAILSFILLFPAAAWATQINTEKAGIIGNVVKHSSAETGITMIVDYGASEEFIPAVGIEVIIEGAERRSTFTDEKGEFVFLGLEPGEYRIDVISPLYMGISVTDIALKSGEILDLRSYMPSGIPIGSVFYLFAGINREDQAFYADSSALFIYDVFTNFNVLSSDTVIMNNDKFSKDAFKDYIENLGQKLTQADQFVFYYSGITFLNPADDKVYLDCSDGVYIQGNPIYETLISEDEIVNWLNDNFISASNVVIILDAPYSQILGETIVNRLWSPVCVIAGAKDDQWYEIIDYNAGAFTMSAISGFLSINQSNGLPYADIDGDGKVTIKEMISFVSLFLEYMLDGIDLKQEVSAFVNNMQIVDTTIFVLNR